MSFQDTGFQNNAFQMLFIGIVRVILSVARLLLPQTLVKLNTPTLKVSLQTTNIDSHIIAKLSTNTVKTNLQTINIDNCIEVKLND